MATKRKEIENALQTPTKKRKPNASPKQKKIVDEPIVRDLVSVIDRLHKSEVDKNLHCRKVNDENGQFNDVRRNKKIQKIVGSKEPIKTIISAKQPLNVIPQRFHGKGIYHKNVIGVFNNPEDFKFVKINEEDFRWDVHPKRVESEPANVILTTDYSQADLIEMKGDLERDMGVLKASVDYLTSNSHADLLPITTHPGHHAGPNQIANYCIINNGIVTAAMIKQHKPKQKIGILDLDAHPGDGTKQLVEKNDDLIDRYVSLHTDEEFSNMETFRNESKAIIFPRSEKLKGRKRNVTWGQYASKLQGCLENLSESKLHVLIVCIGFDTLKEDPIAGLEIGFQLLPIHFRKIGAMLAQQNSQIVFIQEGGYDTNLTADAFENLIKGFRVGRKFQAISSI